MRSVMLAVLMVGVALAGCTTDGEPNSGEEQPTGLIQYEDPTRNLTIDAPQLPVDPPVDGERTLHKAPEWRLGEWWQIRLTEHFSNQTWEFYRIVAGTEGGNYVVGFPLETFLNEVLVMHTPGFGDIRNDISYGAHDVPFVPVQFPLVVGESWSTAWEAEGATMDMTVEAIQEDGSAIIIGSPTGTGAYPTRIVYDPEIGEVRELLMSGYADYEVIDHGYYYEGDVRVPHAHDLVLLNGRSVGVNNIQSGFLGGDVAGPIEEVEIGEGYDRISFANLMFDLPGNVATQQGGPSAPTGIYRVKVTAPDGTIFEDTFTPADGHWIKATFYGHENPAGTWTVEAEAGGAGAAFVEGIGYHSIDINLPSGCVLESHNAGHHGTLCQDDRQSPGLAQ